MYVLPHLAYVMLRIKLGALGLLGEQCSHWSTSPVPVTECFSYFLCCCNQIPWLPLENNVARLLGSWISMNGHWAGSLWGRNLVVGPPVEGRLSHGAQRANGRGRVGPGINLKLTPATSLLCSELLRFASAPVWHQRWYLLSLPRRTQEVAPSSLYWLLFSVPWAKQFKEGRNYSPCSFKVQSTMAGKTWPP